jgi:hypothetical protein
MKKPKLKLRRKLLEPEAEELIHQVTIMLNKEIALLRKIQKGNQNEKLFK